MSEQVESLNFINNLKNWRESMEPISVGTDWLIGFPWSQIDSSERKVIRIDPSITVYNGFHFGAHAILNYLPQLTSEMSHSDSVLDYGCGSGVLAIACQLLQFHNVRAFDIDSNALKQAEKNRLLNHLNFKLSDELTEGEEFDLILANLPLRVHLSVLSSQLQLLKPRGRLVATGFDRSPDQKQELAYEEALKAHSDFEVYKHYDEGNAIYTIQMAQRDNSCSHSY